MVDNLEACPFCGSDQTFIAPDRKFNDTTWEVGCKACFCHVGRDLEADAIAAWNRRTPANGEQVERVARDIWFAMKRAFLKDAGPEYDEIGATIAVPHLAKLATLSTPTEDARSRVNALEEAAQVARSTHDDWQRFRKAGGVSLGAETYDEHDCDHAARVAIGIATAITALGNKETDRHG